MAKEPTLLTPETILKSVVETKQLVEAYSRVMQLNPAARQIANEYVKTSFATSPQDVIPMYTVLKSLGMTELIQFSGGFSPLLFLLANKVEREQRHAINHIPEFERAELGQALFMNYHTLEDISQYKPQTHLPVIASIGTFGPMGVSTSRTRTTHEEQLETLGAIENEEYFNSLPEGSIVASQIRILLPGEQRTIGGAAKEILDDSTLEGKFTRFLEGIEGATTQTLFVQSKANQVQAIMYLTTL
jgi:hypothetical protein